MFPHTTPICEGIGKVYTFVWPYNTVRPCHRSLTPPRSGKDEDSEEEVPEGLPSGLVINPSDDDIDPRLQLRDELGESLAGTEFGDSVVLPLDAAQELTKDHLREIIDHLRENDPQSVSHLAEELDVNTGNMSRYLNTLMKYDVVAIEHSGKAKRPRLKYDHILFEPLY